MAGSRSISFKRKWGQTNVDPQAWLADLLARINDHSIQRLTSPALN